METRGGEINHEIRRNRREIKKDVKKMDITIPVLLLFIVLLSVDNIKKARQLDECQTRLFMYKQEMLDQNFKETFKDFEIESIEIREE
jgi:hypothetical protein